LGDTEPKWFRVGKNGRLQIDLMVQPGAKSTEFCGLHGDRLKIKVAAPPVEGAANTLLIKFVAEELKLKKQQVMIIIGESSRSKTIELDVDLASARGLLDGWARASKK
jgi:uncharacterized protein (TIGR00251 family)